MFCLICKITVRNRVTRVDRFDIVCSVGSARGRGGDARVRAERGANVRCCTYQHFGEAPLELDSVRHRLSRGATHAAAARVSSAQAAHAHAHAHTHAHARLTRVMGHAGLDTADENLTHTSVTLPATTLHDAHVASRLARASARAPADYHGRKFSVLSTRAAARPPADAARLDVGRISMRYTCTYIHTHAHDAPFDAHDGATHARLWTNVNNGHPSPCREIENHFRRNAGDRARQTGSYRNVQQVSSTGGCPSRAIASTEICVVLSLSLFLPLCPTTYIPGSKLHRVHSDETRSRHRPA